MKTTENACAETRQKDDTAPSKINLETVLGPVIWLDENTGFVRCPGYESHSTRSGKKDCKLYLNGAPTLHCVHSSCRDLVRRKNDELRRMLRDQLGESQVVPYKPNPAQVRKELLRKRVAASKGKLLQQHRWTYDQMKSASPVAVQGFESDHSKMLLDLFKPGDIVWIGSTFDSGKEIHACHFLPVETWKQINITDQFVCPATFKTGSFSRGNNSILTRRFLVVESDELGKDEVGAIFAWLKNAVGLNLRAIVDTAGKSLHGWFDFPSTELLEELKIALPELGCDPKLFTASQPVRLPGAIRDGKYQRLIYLDRKEVA